MKIDDVKVTKKFDRRRKLTDEQKDEIRKRYEMENTSLQKLANEYCVSKSLILIIVNPERAEAVREANREYSANNKVSSKQRAEYMRRHRKFDTPTAKAMGFLLQRPLHCKDSFSLTRSPQA